MIERIESQVLSCPVPIGGRVVTTDIDESGLSSSNANVDIPSILDQKYSDEKVCYAPVKATGCLVCGP